MSTRHPRLLTIDDLKGLIDDGTEGCNYLLSVDIDMNTVDGYAMSSWEKGYGDMEFASTTTPSGC